MTERSYAYWMEQTILSFPSETRLKASLPRDQVRDLLLQAQRQQGRLELRSGSGQMTAINPMTVISAADYEGTGA